MSRIRFYRAYCLLIESEIPLAELLDAEAPAADQSVDVRIRRGSVGPGAADGRRQTGPLIWCADDQLWLEVAGIARFLVRGGTEIVVEAEPGMDEESVRLFLLGSVFGALLAQRGLLVLHGNAVRIGEQCLVCVGPSGIGKSTLAAGFAKRGHTLLADDVVPLDDEGRALPGFPRVKLWQDSAEQLGVDTRELRRIRPQLAKYNYPLGERFEQQPLPVRWIYVLESAAVEQPQFSPILGMQRFPPLLDNTYRLRFLNGMGRKAEHLAQCGRLAARSHLVLARRPSEGFDLDRLIDSILDDLRERA
ncbi:hypothetical protein [Pseudomonas panipatensis]|uniref:HPr Serine kinase C-terminal domain-containing protein n=1 Tax=Pseudomonas panipatensis TaxID=428992 RepID=A0A1G8LIK1_9PSED|nr:hypothetical protein [Pseudomonas panipatensis]SDI55287.1 HPr Serine kinase C-terminal domain-containing protein [Pseudomonas panipatensis]SMP74867.1 Hpr(Ser) kinase/phosphatase [Pseudomonas panipatensis]